MSEDSSLGATETLLLKDQTLMSNANYKKFRSRIPSVLPSLYKIDAEKKLQNEYIKTNLGIIFSSLHILFLINRDL